MRRQYADASVWRTRAFSATFTRSQMDDLADWHNRFYPRVAGSVAYAMGDTLHMWHGELVRRKYSERYLLLKDADFDPRTDIALDAGGCWTWNSNKAELHRRVAGYFAERREDE